MLAIHPNARTTPAVRRNRPLDRALGCPGRALRRLRRDRPQVARARQGRLAAKQLEGMSWAEAARLADMERQALRDAASRYNAEGFAGLHDRPSRGGPAPHLLAPHGGPPRSRWAGRDPWENLLDILIREILQPSVRRPSGVVFSQHVRDSIGVDILRLGQQPVGLLEVSDRLLVQAAFGEPARL
jgi:hypothetical protein